MRSAGSDFLFVVVFSSLGASLGLVLNRHHNKQPADAVMVFRTNKSTQTIQQPTLSSIKQACSGLFLALVPTHLGRAVPRHADGLLAHLALVERLDPLEPVLIVDLSRA